MFNVLSNEIAGGGPLGVIASMITPAFLILGAASLIGSALVRLNRAVDRARSVIDRINTDREGGNKAEAGRFAWQLQRYRLRALIVEIALSAYYLAIGCFVAASLGIAVTHVSNHANSWVPAWLTVAGAVLLFVGTLLLFTETTIATAMLRAEIADALETAR